MAKSQKRSNKEIKKPKKVKEAVASPSGFEKGLSPRPAREKEIGIVPSAAALSRALSPVRRRAPGRAVSAGLAASTSKVIHTCLSSRSSSP